MAILKKLQAIALSLTVTISMLAIPAKAADTASGKDLEQLVAPIALYPDALVAQVLAGSTYPPQIVEAERWLQQNKNLKDAELAAAVDKQAWDPSIKALTQFPDVLSNMNQNLSWTSALGDAYFNDANGVMNAIQVLRNDAKNAGNLKSTPEQTVSSEGQTITIEPASQETVYVPSYGPDIYGEPIAAYPGYSGWGAVAGTALSFGVGMAVGGAWNNSWGWRGWGANWHGGSVTYNRNNYVSRSNTFANRNTSYNRANVGAGNAGVNRAKPSVGNQVNRQNFDQANRGMREGAVSGASRGYGTADRSSMGRSSGAFGGVSQGGAARMNSSRGAASFSGGRAGGGGGRAGGGRAGGGGRR